MAVRMRLGDRRGHARFECRGQLWGELDLSKPVILQNIGPAGALVETALTTSQRSPHFALLSLQEDGPHLYVVVRHVTPASERPGEERHLFGLEFVRVSAADRARLDAIIRKWEEPRRLS